MKTPDRPVFLDPPLLKMCNFNFYLAGRTVKTKSEHYHTTLSCSLTIGTVAYNTSTEPLFKMIGAEYLMNMFDSPSLGG